MVLMKLMEISRIDYGRFDELTAEDPFKSWNDDEVLAEAQDGQGLNNANFAPLLMDLLVKCRCIWRVSVWRIFDVIEPTSNTDLLGTYASTRFPFIPIPREEDDSINSALVLVEDDGSSFS
jgi:hypothetical protein